jgi:hypothetical protein
LRRYNPISFWVKTVSAAHLSSETIWCAKNIQLANVFGRTNIIIIKNCRNHIACCKNARKINLWAWKTLNLFEEIGKLKLHRKIEYNQVSRLVILIAKEATCNFVISRSQSKTIPGLLQLSGSSSSSGDDE